MRDFLLVIGEPARIRLVPAFAVEPEPFVGPIPLGRVGLAEDRAIERDSVAGEESDVAAEARLRRIRQSAVPVEEDGGETVREDPALAGIPSRQRFSIGTKCRSPDPRYTCLGRAIFSSGSSRSSSHCAIQPDVRGMANSTVKAAVGMPIA